MRDEDYCHHFTGGDKGWYMRVDEDAKTSSGDE